MGVYKHFPLKVLFYARFCDNRLQGYDGTIAFLAPKIIWARRLKVFNGLQEAKIQIQVIVLSLESKNFDGLIDQAWNFKDSLVKIEIGNVAIEDHG